MYELVSALASMRRGKAKDDSRILAEMLKDGAASLLEILLDIFNEVLSLCQPPPEFLEKSVIKIMFMKGDQKLP